MSKLRQQDEKPGVGMKYYMSTKEEDIYLA